MKHDIVVAGASAGGVQALMALAAGLPRDYAGSVFVVLHVPPDSPSLLPELLRRAGPLPAGHARDGEPILPGRLYVAPPDNHLLVEKGRVRVSRGPRENHCRPALDPLFRSAALAYGPRVAGVVLSGALDDGSSGLYAVKERGGVAIVQDPAEAEHDSMPANAMRAVSVDHCLRAEAIGPLLAAMAREGKEERAVAERASDATTDRLEIEVKVAGETSALEAGVLTLGHFTAYTCPECSGVLIQIDEGPIIRFRCHTGHAFTLNVLLAEVSKSVEASLWSALRTLEESDMLLKDAAAAAAAARPSEGEHYREQARRSRERVALIRQAILEREKPDGSEET